MSLLVFLSACSDYQVNPDGDQGKPFDTGDSWTPPVVDDSEPEDSPPVDTEGARCIDQFFPGQAVAQNDECYSEAEPVGTFTPIVEWKKETFTEQAGSTEIMMMPAVGPLEDTNGDGKADENDIPDVVVITYGSSNCVRVVSGDGSGNEVWSQCDAMIQGQGGVAIGDIDNDGWMEVLAATTSGVRAYDHDGNTLWDSDSMMGHIYGTSDNPAISDMDHDGNPEIIMGSAILDNTGNLIGSGSYGMGGVEGQNVGVTSFAVDVDGDGEEEVVTGNALYTIDGTAIWHNGETDGYVAVGNFDSDDMAEIVVSQGGNVRLQDDDGTVLCTQAIPGAGSGYYGGPPTVADFDGDGEAEFACAAGSRYSVFESDCSIKWQMPTQDASSGNTGSSVFDFEGDGAAEAVYADETRLWVFDGTTGSVKLESTEHSNATWLEYPAVVDVDGDDHAEIVVANTSGKHGFYVFGDADNTWRPGRKIWNQHAYFITNVNDDGSIPANADRNWLTYNNFRSGDLDAATGGASSPDLVVDIPAICTDECWDDVLKVWVTVANPGFNDIETDVLVELVGVAWDSTETIYGSKWVTETIAAGRQIDSIQFDLSPAPTDVASFFARVDHGNSAFASEVRECNESNNETAWGENLCL